MKTIVLGREVEYGVEEKTGIFGAEYNGERYTHATLNGLKQALESQMKKKSINKPLVRLDYSRDDKIILKHGVVVGAHSGNGNLLIKWEGERSPQQIYKWNQNLMIPSIDVKKLKELHKIKNCAEKALEAFLEKNRFDYEAISEAYRKDTGND